MPAVATERWSDRTYQRGESAQRAWDVINAVTEEEAIQAVTSAFGVTENSTHPLDSRLRVPVGGMGCTAPGFRFNRVSARYGIPSTGGTDPGGGGPLDEPAEIFPDFQYQNEPVNKDIHDNPITNSARIPFGQNVTDDATSILIQIARWESTFDIQKALAYAGGGNRRAKLNSDQVTISRVGTLLPGQLKCKAIKVAQGFAVNATTVRVVYILEARPYYDLGAGKFITGFAKRVLDQGQMGFYSESGLTKPGRIVGKNNQEVTQDVLLFGNGTPFDPQKYFVNSAASSSASVAMPNTVGVEITSTGTWLYYTVNEPIAFSGLSLPST